jgi:YesN/AraC family two-component response regulator
VPAGDVAGAAGVTRVFLVDDQALVRAGLRMVIDAQPDMSVVGEGRDGREALERLAGPPSTSC